MVHTNRQNNCENIVEALNRQGKFCASVHAWYFENRGTTVGNEKAPYIQNLLPNFEERVNLMMDYLEGKNVPSLNHPLKKGNRPDFIAIYADDLDCVCHNGSRLPYKDLERAQNIDAWYDNYATTLSRMDKALLRILQLEDVTVALMADHGSMPYHTAYNGVSKEEACKTRGSEVVEKLEELGLHVQVMESDQEEIKAHTEAVLLLSATQGQLTYIKQVENHVQRQVKKALQSLFYIQNVLDKRELNAFQTYEHFADVYFTTFAPYQFTPSDSTYVGGAHSAMEDSIMHVFGAFYGKHIKQNAQVFAPTTLVDFVPTACHIMGVMPPKDSVGRIIYDIIE